MKEEIRKRVKAELKRKEHRKNKYKVDPRLIEYYSKFAKKPSKKKKKYVYESSEESDSDELTDSASGSSSDNSEE